MNFCSDSTDDSEDQVPPHCSIPNVVLTARLRSLIVAASLELTSEEARDRQLIVKLTDCDEDESKIGCMSIPASMESTTGNRHSVENSRVQHFELLQQPKLHQRKSYSIENRFLAPNPITLRYRKGATAAHESAWPRFGRVFVVLVDSEKPDALVGGGPRMLTIGGAEALALFSLKIMASSREDMCLAFDVEWVGIDGVERRERVISDKFFVHSNSRPNRRERTLECPLLPSTSSSALDQLAPIQLAPILAHAPPLCPASLNYDLQALSLERK
jgi:hypothetical protein